MIVTSRGAGVIKAVMGEAKVAVWVSDCWKPQFHAPAERFQICLVHQVRNLQGLLDRCPRLKRAQQMQQFFRSAMHLAKRRETLTATGHALRVQVLERRLTGCWRNSLGPRPPTLCSNATCAIGIDCWSSYTTRACRSITMLANAPCVRRWCIAR